MKLIPHFPRPPLSRFVELIWAVRGKSDHAREKVLPNGAVELIINLGGRHKVVSKEEPGDFEVYRESWLAGMQEEHLVIEALGESDLLGVRFRPGGAYPFLRFPVSEVTNRVVESDLVFGPLLRDLRETLIETKEYGRRIRLVEEFLLKRIDPALADPLVAHALREIRKGDGRGLVRELSREAGFSHKHLITRFRKAAGLPPKLLYRIFRFQSVIGRVKNLSEVRWTEVAHDCGYFDQAHMIREFHLFSGSNPSQYLRHRDDDENHVVVR